MPMMNSDHVTRTPAVHSRSLIENTYAALKKRVRDALREEWPRFLPMLGYYHHPPALDPQPFVGLNTFIAW